MRSLILVTALLGAVSACGQKSEEPPPRTAAEQRAVDSTVGASRLPGAGGVRSALQASDSAAARARLLDSLSRNP
jgi:hypothetical protein